MLSIELIVTEERERKREREKGFKQLSTCEHPQASNVNQ